MFNPFKPMRAKTQKKLRRVAVSAMTNVWTAMMTPAKPTPAQVKRKTNPKAQPAPRVQSTIPRATIPRGARFTDGTYQNVHGSLAYKLYIPALAKTAPTPLPLIVMLHGCGQTPQDFARDTGMNKLADEFGFLVLYPAQSRESHALRCWRWYEPGDQARGAGEPDLIARLTRDVMAHHKVDPRRVYAAGLSAGGSAALILAIAYPDIFAAVGVHSGLPRGAARDARFAAAAMQTGDPGLSQSVKMPTIIFHGDADKIVNPRNGRFVALRALEPYGNLDHSEKSGRVKGGATYLRKLHRVGRGRPYIEQWVLHGVGHAWSGGHGNGRFTDATGPDASREMVRFFLRHRIAQKRRVAP